MRLPTSRTKARVKTQQGSLGFQTRLPVTRPVRDRFRMDATTKHVRTKPGTVACPGTVHTKYKTCTLASLATRSTTTQPVNRYAIRVRMLELASLLPALHTLLARHCLPYYQVLRPVVTKRQYLPWHVLVALAHALASRI